MSIRSEAKKWATTARPLPSKQCLTCAFLARNKAAAEFHAGVVDVLREGGTIPIAALFREMQRRFKMPSAEAGFRCHWGHVKSGLERG